jgi:hypothetical protein
MEAVWKNQNVLREGETLSVYGTGVKMRNSLHGGAGGTLGTRRLIGTTAVDMMANRRIF